MKAETQAVLLEKMMQKKKVQPVYELTLPLFSMKQSLLKKLTKGDILLLGLDSLEIIVLQNEKTYANVMLLKNEKIQEIEIISTDNTWSYFTENPKYEVLKCLLSTIGVESFDVGTKQDISNVRFEYVTLYTEKNVKRLEGKLVEVEGNIAIEVTKVYGE